MPLFIVLATGATARPPSWVPAEYIEMGFVPDARQMARDMLGRSGREPGRVLLFDQDHTEMTYALAELLCEHFEGVTLVTPRERIASDVSLINRQSIYQRLYEKGVDIRTSVVPESLDRLEDATVDLRNVYSGVHSSVEEVVAVCYSTSRMSDDDLLLPLREHGLVLRPIGDCKAPRTVLAATREGYDVAMSLN